MTITEVRDGIISTLHQQFPDIPIRGEEIKQGFVAPCFFVRTLDTAQDREVDRRYKRYHSFDIHYFPVSEVDANQEMLGMAEQLYGLLEYITPSGSLIRGTGLRHEIVDGVLHFFVNYVFHVMRDKEPVPPMQTMKQEGYIRE